MPNCTGFAVCFSRLLGAEETQIEASFCEAIRIAKEQKSVSLAETRRSNLRRISPPKSERVRRTWIPTTSLVTARSALSLGLVVGSPALSNKRLRCKARTLRLQEIR